VSAYLILTRSGYASLGDAAGKSLYVNPGILTDGELAALADAGATVQILARAVDPHAHEAIASAVRAIGASPLWVDMAAEAAQAPAPTVRFDSLAGSATNAPRSETAQSRSVDLAGALGETAVDTPQADTAQPRFADLAGAWAAQAWRGAVRRLRRHRTLVIVPYLGYGNADCLWVRGRVLFDDGWRTQSAQDSRWRNALELLKRLESDEAPGVRVRAAFDGTTLETVTDAGGYFSFDIAPPSPPAGGWHTVELTLDGDAAHAAAEVLVPPAGARFGIVSDIDDTVLWTNVTNKLNMLAMLAQTNAHTRKPFRGVAALYRALVAGAGGAEDNPIFYVSSSPWHLFGPLVDFLRLQGIPVGPLLLKSLGVRQLFGPGRHSTHKLDRIEAILRAYPALPFVLIGDSGEHDPEIYAELVRRHPGRIRAIYIRSVDPDPARADAIDALAAQVGASGAQLVLAPDSVFAATHAAAEGLIAPAALAEVRAGKRAEDAA
jgi:phosphatidate phosphatase APP1